MSPSSNPLFINEFLPFVSASCLPHQVDALKAAGYVDLYILNTDGKIYRRLYLSHGREITLEVKSLPPVPGGVAGAAAPAPVVVKEDLSKFLPGGRIPLAMFRQIQGFFKQVCETHGQALEAHCYIMYSTENGYYIHVPEQTVSGGTVEFSYQGLNADDCIVVDIHSHGSMSAFFSGTDDGNDRRHIYFSGVVGKVNTPNPEITFRFNMYDVKKPATLHDIFHEETAPVQVPAEWLAQVKKREYQGTTYPVGTWVGQGHRGNQTTPSLGTAEDRWSHWNKMGKPVGVPGATTVPLTAQESRDFQKKTNLSAEGGGTTISAQYDQEPVSVKEQETSDYIACQYGIKSKETFEMVMDGISSLAGEDEIMKQVLSAAYNKLSSRGQESIQTFGIH